MSAIQASLSAQPIQMLYGYVDIGDVVGSAAAALPVSGQVLAASRAAVTGGVLYTFTLPNMGSTNYPLWIQAEGRGGNLTLDNDIAPPLIRSKTATSVQVFMEETGAVAQTLRIHVYAVSETRVQTMVQPQAGFVTADSGFVQMDNLRVRPTLLSGDGVLIASVTGTFQASFSGWSTFNTNANSHRGSSRYNVTVSTVFAAPFPAWNASSANGNEVRLLVIDRTNKRAYRVTTSTEAGVGASFAMIERLA